jgi:hypothetical protein
MIVETRLNLNTTRELKESAIRHRIALYRYKTIPIDNLIKIK